MKVITSIKKIQLTALLTALLWSAGTVYAGFLGSTVTTQYYAYGEPYIGGGSPETFIADGTVQHTFSSSSSDYFNLIVSDDTIEYDYLSDVAWSESAVSLNTNGLFIRNGNLLTFVGATPILSIIIDPLSTVVPGFTIANVTSNSNNVAVEWTNVSFHKGDKVILSMVPEPETCAMLLTGLGLIGSIARRRKN
jgi:hypothetical protein